MKLNQAEAYLNNIIDSMPSIIIGIDSQGNVTHWNLKAQESFKIKVEDAIGKSIKIDHSCHTKEAITKADPSQIEQALLNFCVNASHAMTIMKEEDKF